MKKIGLFVFLVVSMRINAQTISITPAAVEIFTSTDGSNFTAAGNSNKFEKGKSGFATGYYNVGFSPVAVRYVKVVVKTHGIIAEGNRFAGNKAWVFVDEIQVN